MTMTDHTHAIDLTCWVEGANGHPDFPVQNLPLGIFSPPRGGPSGCRFEWTWNTPSPNHSQIFNSEIINND